MAVKSKEIIIVLTGLVCGGAEMQVLQLIKALRGGDFKFTVVCISNKYSDSLKKAYEAVADVHILGASVRKPWTLLSTLYQLRQLILLRKPAIVHCHLVHAIILGGAVRRLTFLRTTKFIGTFHGQVELTRLNSLTSRLVGGMHLFTAVGPHLRDTAMSVLHNASVIHVPNGIDFSIFHAKSREVSKTRRLVAIGRLSKEKNFDSVIRAFSFLDESFTLHIIGRGPERSHLENLAVELDVNQRTFFYDEIPVNGSVLSQFDILLSGSKSEGFSLTICEALACECRVVAFDFPGLEHLFPDATNICPHQDLTLAEKVIELYDESEDDWNMARITGRRVVERYDISKVVKHWEKIYHELLAKT